MILILLMSLIQLISLIKLANIFRISIEEDIRHIQHIVCIQYFLQQYKNETIKWKTKLNNTIINFVENNELSTQILITICKTACNSK